MTPQHRNFLFVGTQRTGSSALAEIIDKQDDMVCGWEWTQRVAPWKQIELAKLGLAGVFTSLKDTHQQHMARSITAQSRWLGFRRLFRSSDKWIIHPRFSPSLLIDRLEGHIEWLSKNPQIHVFHIVRYDNIEWLKSKYMSKAAGSYVGRKYPEELKVTIPVNKSIKRLLSKEWIDQRLADLEQTNRYIRIVYEDFLEQPERVTATMLEFLGAGTSTRQEETVISRQSLGPASDYIINFSDLEAALRRSKLLKSSLESK